MNDVLVAGDAPRAIMCGDRKKINIIIAKLRPMRGISEALPTLLVAFASQLTPSQIAVG